MSITRIQRLHAGAGRRVVPDIGDYDDASPAWTESEHRADLPGSASIAGFWEGEPGWVRIDNWPYHEVCVVLAGRVAVEDADGERVEFGAGEAFVVPRGFEGVWHTLESTKKVFVGVDPYPETDADLSLASDTEGAR